MTLRKPYPERLICFLVAVPSIEPSRIGVGSSRTVTRWT
jgi:hypothetical protein